MLFERKWVTHKVVNGIPIAGRVFFEKVPSPIMKLILERGLNTALRNRQLHEELKFIGERRILIKVTDLDAAFSVGFEKNQLTIEVPCHNGDVAVSATLGDFIALIGGTEDPDTLFFRRRLKMTGDTELGLAVKNFLDRVETQEIFPAFFHRRLLQIARAFAERPA